MQHHDLALVAGVSKEITVMTAARRAHLQPPQRPADKIVVLFPNQPSDARRRAMRGTYTGRPYGDGKTVRLVRSAP